MTSLVMMNAEKLREKMAEQKDADHDQTTWVSCGRIERLRPHCTRLGDGKEIVRIYMQVQTVADSCPFANDPCRANTSIATSALSLSGGIKTTAPTLFLTTTAFIA